VLLSDLIEPRFIHLSNEMCSQGEAIRHLLEELRKNTPAILDLDTAARAVEQRSCLGGIALPAGIALPRARLDDFEDLPIGICPAAGAISMADVMSMVFQ
jgi:mannitol/fructose-specific phosphotransferase system IIA component (Ntr-type)